MVPLPSVRPRSGHFSILEDEHTLDEPRAPGGKRTDSSDSRGSLEELSVEHCQNQKRTGAPDPASKSSRRGFASSPDKSGETRTGSRRLRRRRLPISSETFEPLDAVQEEASVLTNSDTSALCGGSPETISQASLHQPPQDSYPENHPLEAAEPDSSVRQQLVKHLSGQFEWLMSPVPAGSTEHHGSLDDDASGQSRTVIFGCNLLVRKRRPAFSKPGAGSRLADSYTLIATPLEGNATLPSGPDPSTPLAEQVTMALSHSPMSQGTPLKVPSVVNVAEQAVSPAHSFTSEKSSLFLESTSPAGSFSSPRIEDSLEELDRLEDQLEAFNAVTGPRRGAPSDGKKPNSATETPQGARPAAAKRVSIAGHASTVRVKASEKTRPAIRRSASLTLRGDKSDGLDIVPEQKAHASLSRAKSTSLRPTDAPKPPIKSTKPPTVPKFELPGEAVSRRLKEQREARQAQRAEAEKANVAPPRPKSNKPLTKPTFELPGEAISRRKREEREAKLKAQEEEERKRREFKARPMRQSVAPSTLPRDTVTSRARQAKPTQEEFNPQQGDASRSRRSIAGPARSTISNSTASSLSHGRGRHSISTSLEEASRATSTSVGSTSGKRSTLSAEEAAQLRSRGKEIFQRDSSFSKDREVEKRDREANARLAREQAADRSRAAGREWAEKKRRRELAMREGMRASAPPPDTQ